MEAVEMQFILQSNYSLTLHRKEAKSSQVKEGVNLFETMNLPPSHKVVEILN